MKHNSLRVAVLLIGMFLLPSAHAFTLTTQPNQWYLISLPGDAGQSLGEFFDGKLDPARFRSGWTVYPFDSDAQNYKILTVNSKFSPGEAFWFLHKEAGPVDVEVALDVTTAPIALPEFCPSPTIGCFELELPVGDGAQWSLIGTPFPEGVMISDVRMVTNGGACATGCTIEQATTAGLTYGDFFDFDEASNKYLPPLDSGDYLEAAEGYWLATKIPANVSPAYLLFPTFCTPFN